ncbi:MAG: SBBP repeat-containing protein, partial [Thermoflavifilum sp.]|nr:SBBP repeat-containing protein [Thermoflavifilum sp.]
MLGLCQNHPAFGQSSFGVISFQENKGQWPSDERYRADLGNGQYVVLRQQGFGVVLYDTADLERLQLFTHGHPSISSASQPASGSASASAYHHPRSRFPRPILPHHPKPPLPEDSLSVSPGNNPIVLHGCYYQVRFIHSQVPQVIPDHEVSTRYHYFLGNDPARWARDVGAYGGITYASIYPQIDVRFYFEAGRLKYDWIIHPGGKISAIQMQYSGVESLEVKKGNLLIHTAVGDVTELEPFCYQYINGQRVEIPCAYVLNSLPASTSQPQQAGKGRNLQVSFRIKGDYQPGYPLIIDPVVVFATFTGSTSDNWGFTATYDAQGNFYAGGIVFGGGYPVTPGAFQQQFAGGQPEGAEEYGYDMAIAKFDPTGKNLLYATYLGGSGNEQPHSLIVNHQGNLIIAGRTNSPDFPHDHQYGSGGGYDIVVAELSPDGRRLVHSTLLGGSYDDGVNITYVREAGTVSLMQNYGDDARSEVIVDASDQVYLASCTQSPDFPVTPGSFQIRKGDNSNLHGGSITISEPGHQPYTVYYTYRDQDAVVLKLNPDLTLNWASFLGGSGNDAAYVIDLDPAGNIYVGGATSSRNFPVAGTGVWQAGYQGGDVDGFVAEISNDGRQLLRRTYLGTPGIDEVYGLAFDQQGYPYVCGTTTGNWPVMNAAYVEAGGKQFIAKLKPDLSGFVYSTTFGTNSSEPNISPVAFLV